MEKQYQIYKLINPINNDVFYIGKTSNHLQVRLNTHISVKTFCKKLPINIYIENLLSNKIKPIIEFIKFEENKTDERDLIREYSKTYKLCNKNHTKVIYDYKNDNRLNDLIDEYQEFLSKNITSRDITYIAYKTKKCTQTILNYLNLKNDKKGKNKAKSLIIMQEIVKIGLQLLNEKGIVR